MIHLFPWRDLDHEAEEFIVGWARELPADQPIRIVVHFPDIDVQTRAAKELSEALGRYFSYRVEILQSELNELFRVGRHSRGIGVFVLIVCLVAAHLAGRFLIQTPFNRLVEESFLILGWVANWRPLEIFLYDWWPIARRRELYRRLARAVVEVRPFPAEQPLIDAANRPEPYILPCGTKRTYKPIRRMSVIGGKADVTRTSENCRDGPIGDTPRSRGAHAAHGRKSVPMALHFNPHPGRSLWLEASLRQQRPVSARSHAPAPAM